MPTDATTLRLRPFSHPTLTADGAARAVVPFTALRTLWINTGTLCNIACGNCYIESSPTNDALVYPRLGEITPFLDEAAEMGARDVGMTGGEPFMNPDACAIAEAALQRGMSVLILTNAMTPMMRPRVKAALEDLSARFGSAFKLRVSLDHYDARLHDQERGAGAFAAASVGLRWLARRGFPLSVAGRRFGEESEAALRAGFQHFFDGIGLRLDASDPSALVLFPEMDEAAETPEISEACWDLTGARPADMMCADARMIVKRRGAARPAVLACTLVTDDPSFELGETITAASKPVSLNHPHCSRFCVLGGASCSG